MKKTNIWIFKTSLAALALAAASTAFAQNDKDKDKDKDKEKQNEKQNENRSNQANRNTQFYQGTEILNSTVVSEDNLRLGEVKNVALDMDHGRALYVIVDNADNDKLIPVPLAALNFAKEGKKARVNINKQRWQDSPDFDESNWGVINDANWVRIVFQHYGLESPYTEQRAERMDIAKATDVIGMNAVTRDGRDELGECKDFLVQDRTARVPFIVIDAQRRNGNDREVAVPTQLVTLSKNDNTLVVRTDASKINNAPAFTNGSLNNDSQYAQRVFDHFDVQDNVYGYSSPRDDDDNNNRDRDRDRDRNDNNINNNSSDNNRETWQLNSPYGQLFDRNNIVTIDGKVTKVDRITPMSGMDQGVALTVETGNDKSQIVHLGPAWFIERQQHEFRNGEQVRITGARPTRNGDQFIMASAVEIGNRAMLLRDRQGLPAWDAWRAASDVRNNNVFPDNRNRDNDDR